MWEKIKYPSASIKPEYPVESDRKLPGTFIDSQILTAAENRNAEIRSADAKLISQVLDKTKPGAKIIRTSQYLIPQDYKTSSQLEVKEKGGVVVCTKEDAAILFENGASFCTLLLSFDAEGNAVLMHKPLNGAMVEGQPGVEEQLEKELEAFRTVAHSVVGLQNLVLVTGTNAMDESPKQQELLFQAVVNKFAPDAVEPLFIKPRESEYNVSGKLENVKRQIGDTIREATQKDKSLRPSTRDISGIIFIPQTLSTTGKNEIFIINKNTDMKALQHLFFPPE